MNFTPCGSNGTVEGYCILKTVDKKVTAKGAAYLDMTISDKEGEMNAKLWDYKEPTVKFAVNDFVKVRGTVISYNDTEQFRVDRIRHVQEADHVNIEDYVESAYLTGEVMLRQIEQVVEGFHDEELRRLVTAVIAEYRETLLYWPAALKLHHALRGGLLLHTLSILRLAQAVCRVYPVLNADLLFSGVILHDIAKIEEIKSTQTGVATDYTVRGNLLGHLVMGAINIDRIGRANGIGDDTLTLVEHMLISHHGEPEFGAAQFPMFPEAEILSELDLMDARMFEMTKSIEAIDEGEFTSRQWALDNRKLFRHNRGGENRPNLMDEEDAQ